MTVNYIENVELFPILDFRNRSIKLENVTSFEVNTTIQRALIKAIARHGIGLYIYAGEDLPPDIEPKKKPANISSKDWYYIQKQRKEKEIEQKNLSKIITENE